MKVEAQKHCFFYIRIVIATIPKELYKPHVQKA